MSKQFICIHGHFYQPPRENPWTETIEMQESAAPFHDWNEKITSECYRQNGFSPILGKNDKRITQFVNNYAWISFNFGPTLLSWLEEHAPETYNTILEADRISLKRWGHGNAIAQAYNHMILPLANRRDRITQIQWGIADFKRRFKRDPEAMWLPETACNEETLKDLIDNGLKFVILSQHQAQKTRTIGQEKWEALPSGSIDPRKPYRWFVKNGRKNRKFIDIFFYDGTMAHSMSFENLLLDGEHCADRFQAAFGTPSEKNLLVNIATDGETFGHHKKYANMCLAYLIKVGLPNRNITLTNYGAYLESHPPQDEVEIRPGARRLGTSWSCSHGVLRWREDCGCQTGGKQGWNQRWRRPLREALDLLRDNLDNFFDSYGKKLFKDPWKARNAYIRLILDHSPKNAKAFFSEQCIAGYNETKINEGIALLEMQKHSLLMYTSCGWFFADISGIETIQILQYAARAIQLIKLLDPGWSETPFLSILNKAHSNIDSYGTGNQIFNKHILPSIVDLPRVVNHFAVNSTFATSIKSTEQIYGYKLRVSDYRKKDQPGMTMAFGKVRVSSTVVPETESYIFCLLFLGGFRFHTSIIQSSLIPNYHKTMDQLLKMFDTAPEQVPACLEEIFGKKFYTLADMFKEEKQNILKISSSQTA
ncbi:MAG: DUF3536 domain-containing protein [Candidatus Theseobacter exili]|nr:DUF3536 domain-containing protein [Candidatus Theseobacter exili]